MTSFISRVRRGHPASYRGEVHFDGERVTLRSKKSPSVHGLAETSGGMLIVRVVGANLLNDTMARKFGEAVVAANPNAPEWLPDLLAGSLRQYGVMLDRRVELEFDADGRLVSATGVAFATDGRGPLGDVPSPRFLEPAGVVVPRDFDVEDAAARALVGVAPIVMRSDGGYLFSPGMRRWFLVGEGEEPARLRADEKFIPAERVAEAVPRALSKIERVASAGTAAAWAAAKLACVALGADVEVEGRYSVVVSHGDGRSAVFHAAAREVVGFPVAGSFVKSGNWLDLAFSLPSPLAVEAPAWVISHRVAATLDGRLLRIPRLTSESVGPHPLTSIPRSARRVVAAENIYTDGVPVIVELALANGVVVWDDGGVFFGAVEREGGCWLAVIPIGDEGLEFLSSGAVAWGEALEDAAVRIEERGFSGMAAVGAIATRRGVEA